MITVRHLAKSRLKFNKSTSILTIIALVLTTALLMATVSAAIGMADANRMNAGENVGNHHAGLIQINQEQVEIVKGRPELESLMITETCASVIHEKMNGTLKVVDDVIPGITAQRLTDGRMPQEKDEITGPPAFFQRLGYENPQIGDKVSIDYRIQNQGLIETVELEIVGLLEQVDVTEIQVSDFRIAYSGFISKALADSWLEGADRLVVASIRVEGEDTLSYGAIEETIYNIAESADIHFDSVNVNGYYLMWMTDPAAETMGAVIGIFLLIVIFSGLVIYSIYYVSVITNVQELGKLRALGASKKQMRRLLLHEGLTLSAVSIPVGLVLGFLAAKIGLYVVLRESFDTLPRTPGMFSLWALAAVIIIVILTVILSLLKPMRMVSKISPIEAIRYQESGEGKTGSRKGFDTVNLSRLSRSNLSRNRKRTAITIITMGLGGILFLSASGLLASMDPVDYAKNNMPKGDFIINMQYSTSDKTYPENNLNMIQLTDVMGPELTAQISSIPGVLDVEQRSIVLAEIDHPGFPEGTVLEIGAITPEEIEFLENNLRQGEIPDYDELIAQNKVVFPWDSFMEEHMLTIGETLRFTIYDGDETTSFEGILTASTIHGREDFLLPEETIQALVQKINPAAQIIITVEQQSYDQVKLALQEIVNDSDLFTMMSFDEEVNIGSYAMRSVKYSIYGLLSVLGVISFMNLINTMITSIVTRKKELGILQAIGLSNSQLLKMLQIEGLAYTAGTLVLSLVFGNLLGYLAFSWAKSSAFLSITSYHYPLWETVILTAALALGQLAVSFFITKNIHSKSLVERMR